MSWQQRDCGFEKRSFFKEKIKPQHVGSNGILGWMSCTAGLLELMIHFSARLISLEATENLWLFTDLSDWVFSALDFSFFSLCPEKLWAEPAILSDEQLHWGDQPSPVPRSMGCVCDPGPGSQNRTAVDLLSTGCAQGAEDVRVPNTGREYPASTTQRRF